ncbi:MAG: N-acetylglucosamine-6-phosphate deacetylase [Trueperaceae bacterium]
MSAQAGAAPGERVVAGRVLTPAGLVAGRVRFGERILAIEPDDAAGGPAAPIVAPGFVDEHVHGGGGGDAMDGEEGVRALARHHLRHGTTSLLPTTLTAPWSDVLAALRGVAAVAAAPADDEAAVVGAHLEGPFVSPGRLGAQPPFAVDATRERVAEIVELGVVRLATVAPEVPGILDAVASWVAAGVRLNVGHTRADAAAVEAFLEAVRAAGGRAGATHMFNAMGGLEGRAPGPVGALLGDADAAIELICDGHHVAAASVRTAWRAARERLVLITDAIRASGMRDGTTELGGRPVTVKDGAARLADGTLAGSMLTMDAAVRGAVAAGVPLEAALFAASTAPARYLGLEGRGVLEAGARADLVVLTPDLTVRAVARGGRWVVGAPSADASG